MKYLRPETLNDFFEIQDSYADKNVSILAGGTDLMPRYEQGVKLPEVLVDIKHIEELKGIRETDSDVEIGALTTLQDIYKSEIIENDLLALWQSAFDFAAVQIRHRATIGGNICNASPAGDTLPPLYALNAQLKIVDINTEKLIKIQDFISGPGKTGLVEGALLHSIIIPKTDKKSLFFKMGLREAMAISVFNFAVSYKSLNQKFEYLSIACGSVAPTIVFLEEYTSSLLKNGQNIKKELDLIDKNISPIDDIRATAKYRRMALKKSLSYFLEEIIKAKDE